MPLLSPPEDLLRRAKNASTAAERHHCALYALEAALKLAVGARAALWSERGRPGADELDSVLSRMARPSTGTWLELLRTLDQVLRDEEHALIDTPLDGALDLPAWTPLAEAIVAAEVLARPAVRHRTPLEALGVSVAYRNAVIGHGSWRGEAFYKRLGSLWYTASEALIESGVLDGGLALAEGPRLGDLDLRPWVVSRTHPLLDRPQVGFLNKAVIRGNPREVRRAWYLDYSSGEVFEDSGAGLADLLSSLGGKSEAPESNHDDFEIIEELGRGASATVHLAIQRSLGRRVALKVLSGDLVSDSVATKRFEREVRALSRVSHPNVVQLLVAGTRERRPFYGMAYVEGDDLAEVIDSVDLPPAEVCTLFAEAADGLQALHDQGIVHRDVKPSNLVLTADRKRLITVDLGLAQLSDATGDLTASDIRVLGTLRYIAPEQLQRNLLEVDGRADVYGLCATLYHLLCGRPPHDGDTEKRLIQQILFETPPLPPASVGRDLSIVLQTGLAARPEDRYETAALLAADLRAVAAGEPISAKAPGRLAAARRTMKRHPAALGALTTVVALVALGGLWQWDQNRTKVGFYHRIIQENGAWIGVGELPDGASPHTSFRVESAGGLVRRISWPQGQPLPERFSHSWERPPANAIEQSFDDRGQVHEIIAVDDFGTVHWRAAVVHEGTMVTWRYRTQADLPGKGPTPPVTPNRSIGAMEASGVYQVRWTNDPAGRALAADFLDADGHPMIDGHLIAGHRFELDGRGRPVERTFVDVVGQPIEGRYGDAKVEMTYGNEAHPWLVTHARWHDTEGPAMHRDLAAVTHWKHDDYARGTRLWAEDLDGERARVRGEMRNAVYSDMGAVWPNPRVRNCEQLAWVWADDGRILQTRCEGTDGALTPSDYGVAAIDYAWDGGSCPSVVRELGVDGQPTGTRGTSGTRLTCTDGQRITDWQSIDNNGKPVFDADGHRTFGYDGRGRLIENAVLGADGEVVMNTYGAYRRRLAYGPRGGIASVHHLAADGQPMISTRTNFASQEVLRDEFGRKVGMRYLGVDGKPMLRPPIEHDEPHIGDCRLAAEIQEELDGRGRMIGKVMLDDKGRPYLGFAGYVREKLEWSDDSRVLTQWFLDAASQPVTSQWGCVGERSTRDATDNEIEWACLDEDGALKNDAIGLARKITTRDAHGKELSRALFDADDNPTVEAGVHRMEMEYETNRQLRSAVAYGVEGKPTPITSDIWKVSYERSADGLITAMQTEHMSGESARFDLKIDWFGRVFEIEVDDGPLAPYLAPYRRVVYERSAAGFANRVEAWTVDGEHVVALVKRDAQGKALDIRNVDAGGKPVVAHPLPEITLVAEPSADKPIEFGRRPLGQSPGVPVHRMAYRYSDRGDIASLSTFGVDDKPIAIRGIHRTEYEHNERGQLTEVRHYGVHSQSVPGETGAFRNVRRYTEAGHFIESAQFDGEGNPVADERGVARIVLEVDAVGNVLSATNYGEDGEPVKHGMIREVATWDAAGRELSRRIERGSGRTTGIDAVWNADGSVDVALFDTEDRLPAHRIHVDVNGMALAFDAEDQPVVTDRQLRSMLPRTRKATIKLRGDLAVAAEEEAAPR